MAPKIGPETILAEWLFVETVADIRRRSEDPGGRSRYELLGIAPLLRKLLIDASPLLNTVRAARPEVPTEFRIRQWTVPDRGRDDADLPYLLRLGGPELVGRPEDPALPKLKHFIGATVGLVRGRPLTVIEVVKYYANVEGGVHFGVPKEDADRVLSDMAPLLLGHSTGQIEILAHLGTIVVDALTPLCNSILALPTIDNRIHQSNDRGFYDGHWTADHYEKVSQLR
ncbi:hypothetical protein [Paenarthrobacter nitroguajacolicus]|uniref:hypothetical protein n=1 Tax=Paenarthrobacter nitroguajacolicus TaxID=211146 RepID=UPI00285B52B2|nr:hypothetical protein [Paenarthrobacter nitroguajacolicus]MDR6636968.1 hypothetical protein [Paenarthrobacter nitroguajacolicus]